MQAPGSQPTIPLTGVVLCGGKGRRLGQPKATVQLGDMTLLERAARLLRSICNEVVVPGTVVGVPPYCRCVGDAAGVQGPIAGLLAGIRTATFSPVVALACDLPLVTPALLQFLAHRCAEGYLAAVPFAFDRFHTLCAAYSRDILPSMAEWVRRGRYSPCELLRTLDTAVCVVDERALSQFGDPGVLLLNVNSRQDLERARQILGL